jgi:hypothetical protein
MEHLPAKQSIEKRKQRNRKHNWKRLKKLKMRGCQLGSDEEMSSDGENKEEQIDVDEE